MKQDKHVLARELSRPLDNREIEQVAGGCYNGVVTDLDLQGNPICDPGLHDIP